MGTNSLVHVHLEYLTSILESARIAGGLCSTISSFIEAMFWVAVASENSYLMATILKPHGGIDDQPFCASDSEIRMEEQYGLLLLCFWHLVVF